MAKFTFNMPDVGEGVAEAEVVEWHVKVGDRVEEDQHLVDVMTDKATIDIESPVAGVVTALAGEVGDTIAIGAMLLVIEADGEGDGRRRRGWQRARAMGREMGDGEGNGRRARPTGRARAMSEGDGRGRRARATGEGEGGGQ